MKEFRLNVCSTLGEPLNPRTWSATAFNICTELQKLNMLGDTYSSAFPQGKTISKYLLKGFSKLYYQNSQDVERGRLFRAYRSKQVTKITPEYSHTLHLGTLAAPLRKPDKGTHHYLYTDTTWNLWSTQSTQMKGYSPGLIRDSEALERQSYQNFSHIFSISEYLKNNLIEHYEVDPKKITVVGTGRGILKPFYGEKHYDNQRILFAAKGRFLDKGGDIVLKAFRKAREKNPELQLTIVGQNDYSDKIEEPNVTTHGFVSIEELQSFFDSHSLFLMPALNEPWGLVFIEALACRMPIMGLSRNSFPEISGYGKFGFMLDSEDPDKLSELILKSMANPALLAEKGLAGQAYCLEKYTWENVAKTITETIIQKYTT